MAKFIGFTDSSPHAVPFADFTSILAGKWKPFPIVRAVDDLVDNLRTRPTQLIELALGCPIEGAIWHQKLKTEGLMIRSVTRKYLRLRPKVCHWSLSSS